MASSTLVTVLCLVAFGLHAHGVRSDASQDLGRKLRTYIPSHLAKGKAVGAASFGYDADAITWGLYNRYPSAVSCLTSLNYPTALRYTALKASHLQLVQARHAAILEKRMAILQAHYAKHAAIKGMALAKKGVIGLGAASSITPLASLLPGNMLNLNQLGREAIPFLLNGVNRRAESPSLLSLISRLSPDAVGDLEGLISGLFLGQEGNPVNEDMLTRIVSGLLRNMPRDMENLDIPEGVEGLLRIALNAFRMLSGGSAEPGFSGLPSPLPEGLLPNLAEMLPAFLNLLGDN